jgi:diguanylate cyclase (GGDEF)-like protein/PAS domain S-box-containing protein
MSVPDPQPRAQAIELGGLDAQNPSGLGSQLECFVRNAPDAMLVVDGQGRIVYANPGVISLFGYSAPELSGQSMDLLFPHSLGDEPSNRVAALLRPSGACAPGSGIEVEGKCKGGAACELELSLTPLGPSHADHAVWTLRNVTERKREAERIARRERRFSEAQRIANIGNWEWDVGSDRHWWSDELYRMLEIDPADRDEFFDIFMGRLHPDDRERFRQSRDRVLSTGKTEVLNVRIVLPDGTQKVLQTQDDVAFDSEGRPARLSGTMQDITEREAAEARLILSEQRYQEAQRIAKIGNWEWNLATDEHWWSQELYSIIEEDPLTYEASLENFMCKVHEEDRPDIMARTRDVSANPNDPAEAEIRIVLADGRVKVVEMKVDVRTDGQARPTVVAGTIRDVTERWELEALLRESEDRYLSTIELAAIGIAHVDEAGRFIWVNRRLCEMLGYTKEELLGLTFKQVSYPEDADLSEETRADLHADRIDKLKVEKRYVRKDGTVIWVRITSAARRDPAGRPLYDITAIEDVSDRKAAEAKAQYLATHDEMTGLPNRALLNDLVGQAIEAARPRDRRCAVLFIDLDRFKIVNDSLGHKAGDLLLREMASRFRHCIRKADVLARLGGDEFVVLLENAPDPKVVARVARKILQAALKPIEIMEQECRVTASIGIATFPEDAWDTASLLKHADMAMYRAKEEGKNNFQFYSAHDAPIAVEHLVLESHLSHALEQNEFTVQYQPRVDLETGVIKGAEALLRWWNPRLGTVSPAHFIPLAEDTGLIVPIGGWILRAACQQNMAWQRQGLAPIRMSVNLSPRQFKDTNLLTEIAAVLKETGMAPELLELEITESMIMHDVDRAVERASEIKRLGVRLAIDDFGTGYSSLSQLKRFPIDTLKVDRSFVRDVPGNTEDSAITEAIISLGKTLGVTVVAEGVETQAQVAFLRDRACDEMQGFFFSRPCHPDAFAELLVAGPMTVA